MTVRHDVAVDLNALGTVLGAGRLGFASPDRCKRDALAPPDRVSLLALCNDAGGAVEFVIDRALWAAPALQAHPLINTATLILSHADLEHFVAATGHSPQIVDAISVEGCMKTHVQVAVTSCCQMLLRIDMRIQRGC